MFSFQRKISPATQGWYTWAALQKKLGLAKMLQQHIGIQRGENATHYQTTTGNHPCHAP